MSNRKRDGIMLAKASTDRLIQQMPEQVFLQPKIDGLRIKAVKENGFYNLYSSTGLPVTGLPHINDALNKLSIETGQSYTYDGEAYQEHLPFQQISGLVRRIEPDPYAWMIEYHIFDIIEPCQQHERFEMLFDYDFQEEFALVDHLYMVETILTSKDEINTQMKTWIEEGYEGIIVRHPYALYECGKQNCILKIKPKKKRRYKIRGGYEAISLEGLGKNMLGGLSLVDDAGNRFRTGCGNLNHHDRRVWWLTRDQLSGMWAEVEYVTLTKRGVPREPILKRIF